MTCFPVTIWLEFFTNNSEQMTLSGSNLGIGENSPADLLHLKSASGNANVRLTTGNTSSGFTAVIFGDTDDTNTGAVQYDHSNNSLQFEVNNSERMRIHSGGTLSVPTGIELGSGLDGTSANTLDDYEEGTWTPVFGSTSGSFTSVTYSLQVGNYTKIGNRVYIECRLQITAHTLGSASGGLLVAGLPYTVGSPTGIGGNVALSNIDIPASVVNLAVESRENSAQFYAGLYTRDNTTFGNITPANLKSGSTCEIRASAFYYTNS